MLTPQQIKDKCAEHGITMLYDPSQNKKKLMIMNDIVEKNNNYACLVFVDQEQSAALTEFFYGSDTRSEITACLFCHNQNLNISSRTSLFALDSFLKAGIRTNTECLICNEIIVDSVSSCTRCAFSCCNTCRDKCIDIAKTKGFYNCPGCREIWILMTIR